MSTTKISVDETGGYYNKNWNAESFRFDFMGGYKFFPGMLDRRSQRVRLRHMNNNILEEQSGGASGAGAVVVGELLLEHPVLSSARSTAGIPNSSLRDLHKKLCLDIQNAYSPSNYVCTIKNKKNDDSKSKKNSVALSPSLVRLICGARFLGISYCRREVA